jgi:DNA gyrase subunit B
MDTNNVSGSVQSTTPIKSKVPVAVPDPAPSPDDASLVGRVDGEYGADQIKVLEGLDAVRKRPGMYVGGTGLNALHHLVYEVVDNSIDEAMAGHAKVITINIQADGSLSVIDDGRGIPIDPIKDENPAINGRPAVEIVLTILHSGGKFGEENSAYKVSGGLHGVGVSCVNALSEYLECEIFRAGKVYQIEFERGRVSRPLAMVGDIPANSTRTRGTRVTFLPDPTIFPETDFNFDTLETRLRELAYLNPGVTIHLTDERVGDNGKPRSVTFHAKNGLAEYVEHLMSGKNAVSSPIYVRKDEAPASLVCEVAMQYHDGYNELVLSFANNINNVDGGTHAQGFKTALTRTVNNYARKAGVIKDKDPVPTGEDLREGLVAIVSVKLPNPTFNNQPKERLLNPEIEEFVSSAVGEALKTWMEEHPAEAKRLCLKAIVAAQAREAARKARELTRRKTALDSGSMPHKLRDCKTKDFDRSEMFIVEGDSAGGSATQGRNVETQAILPLRGKLLNVEKARLDKVLAFEEIRTLIAALRCGIGEEFDYTKLRYGKVIIMTDADVDGSHIRTLLLTFFFRQMPELIKRGRVFIAQPPLYQLTRPGSKSGRYVLNEKVMGDTLTELGLDRASLVVRDPDRADAQSHEPIEIKRLAGQDLRRAVRLLRRLGDLVEIAERRGVKFPDLLSTRHKDPEKKHRLPTHRLQWQGGDAFAWSEHEAHETLKRHKLALADATSESAAAGPTATLRELHENRELERVFAELASLGLSIDDYALVQEESVSGERLASRFAWVMDAAPSDPSPVARNGDAAATSEDADADESPEGAPADAAPARKALSRSATVVEAPSLRAVLGALHEIGRRGLEIKRFKGLGEMDAEQLWETTMDPARRTMVRVTWDVASEADTLFSVLMGEEVESRRKYIEEHALEVKNLDV